MKIKQRLRYEEAVARYVHRKFFNNAGKLLELGCGLGGCLKGFKSLGFDVKGVDKKNVSEEIITLCLDNDDLPFNSGAFDYVFSKDVIEHLTREGGHRMMEESFRVMKDNGKILIITDDFAYNYARFWDDFTHRTPYTKFSLIKMMEFHNFKIVKSGYWNTLPLLWRINKNWIFKGLGRKRIFCLGIK